MVTDVNVIKKILESNNKVDAMRNILDAKPKPTAKVVAYTIQRAARRFNKTLIVATAHDDLEYDRNPNLLIIKNFGDDLKIQRNIVDKRCCSILNNVKIVKDTMDDYKALKMLHYKKGKVIPKFIYKTMADDELAGVIVYGPAHLALKARNLVEYKKDKNEEREYAKKINNDIVRIWRVIIKPKFRGAGLASKLIRNTLMLTNYSYVETLAVMAQYSNFFESAGMIKVDPNLYNNIDKGYTKALDRLTSLGFDTSMLISKKYCKSKLKTLSYEKLEEVKNIVIKHFYSEKFKHPRALKDLVKGDIDALADALTNRKLSYVYLIWKNPKFKEKPDPKIFLSD